MGFVIRQNGDGGAEPGRKEQISRKGSVLASSGPMTLYVQAESMFVPPPAISTGYTHELQPCHCMRRFGFPELIGPRRAARRVDRNEALQGSVAQAGRHQTTPRRELLPEGVSALGGTSSGKGESCGAVGCCDGVVLSSLRHLN